MGLNGEEFDCLKLRSMCVDAEARLAELQAKNEGTGYLFKMKDDPRITRVGKIIRRFSVDRASQPWNVFRGDMSNWGRVLLFRKWHSTIYGTRRRLRVRPGLTGLWQVSGTLRLSAEDSQRLTCTTWTTGLFPRISTFCSVRQKAVVGSDGAY
ncbi:MAG: sugar transferase [Ancrocorticia sp.]